MREFSLKKFLFAIVFVIVVSTIIPMLFDGFRVFSSWDKYLKTISYGCTFGVLFWSTSALIGGYTRKRRIWRKNPRKGTFVSLLLFILSGITISLGVPYVFQKYVFHAPNEYFWFQVLYTAFMALAIDMIMISVMFSKYLVEYWLESIQNEEKFKQEKLIAQYETLKNQVNPHFLFNSLNTLSGIVEQQPDNAIPFIKKLSDIYRYVLVQKGKDVVPVNEEIEFVTDYIYLMKIRYGNGLHSQIQVNKTPAYIAPLALQMLVENAFKHNAISTESPLLLQITIDPEFIKVINNKQIKTTISVKKPEGLDNLVRRYEYLSNKKVEIIDSEKEFVVKLPVLEKPSE